MAQVTMSIGVYIIPTYKKILFIANTSDSLNWKSEIVDKKTTVYD